ncbi:MAG TPA: enoyl-CoA hydratase/isomerase family protein [Methylomirabilota bacterium]|nr:enoyl-CoA hydratase/isomerase family protein [Methylomirabilota bacterium]
MEHGTVAYSVKDGVARVVLNRPDQLNAISPTLLEDLDRACAVIEGDPSVRAMTLTAAGRAFCAGADLKAVRELSPDPVKWSSFMRLWHRVFNRVEALPVPVVAGVHGLALAGGLELTLVSDLVIADEAARLGDQHANFGLVAGGGGSQRLPRLIGARRAKEMMLLGGWLSAAQALDWGLVNRVAPAGTLGAVVEEVVGAIAAGSGSAARTVKALVNRAFDTDLTSGLELELSMVAAHMRSSEAAEGLRAFAEKRKPVFNAS